MAEAAEVIPERFWGTTLFAAVVLLTAIALLISCVRQWRAHDHGALATDDWRYFRGQFYRRLGTSGLIGLIAVLMFSEPFAPNLKAALGLWLAVLILVVVILAFAIVDWFANRAYLRRVIKELQHRRDELLAEAKAFRKAQD